MSTTQVRELAARAEELVRLAQSGEMVTVTSDGRAVAELRPVGRDRWRTWTEVTDLFAGPADPDWRYDRDRGSGT